MKRVFIAVAGFFLLTTVSYSAPTPIHRECARHNDKISCSCALNNGGHMKVDPKGRPRWQSKRHKSDPINEAFVQCMKANGRG